MLLFHYFKFSISIVNLHGINCPEIVDKLHATYITDTIRVEYKVVESYLICTYCAFVYAAFVLAFRFHGLYRITQEKPVYPLGNSHKTYLFSWLIVTKEIFGKVLTTVKGIL